VRTCSDALRCAHKQWILLPKLINVNNYVIIGVDELSNWKIRERRYFWWGLMRSESTSRECQVTINMRDSIFSQRQILYFMGRLKLVFCWCFNYGVRVGWLLCCVNCYFMQKQPDYSANSVLTLAPYFSSLDCEIRPKVFQRRHS